MIDKNQIQDKSKSVRKSSDSSAVECVCDGEVEGRDVIGCDGCERWYHISCIGMTREVWKNLGKADAKWYCS